MTNNLYSGVSDPEKITDLLRLGRKLTDKQQTDDRHTDRQTVGWLIAIHS